MRIDTVETKLFTLDELSDEAKETAHKHYLSTGDTYPWYADNLASLDAFCADLGVSYTSFEYGGGRDDISFPHPSVYDLTGSRLVMTSYPNMQGVRLWKYIKNNPFDFMKKDQGHYIYTGFHMDECILDPLWEFIDHPSLTIEWAELISECFYTWLYACRDDYEDSQTMESFIENVECNKWEFTIDGAIYG